LSARARTHIVGAATNAAAYPVRSAPSVPKGHVLWGHLPAAARDRLGFFTSTAREFGDVVPLRFGPFRYVLVSHPDLIEKVLVTENKSFMKSREVRMPRLTLGNGLLTSEGDFWLRQRRLAQPAFHRAQVAGYADTMVEAAERAAATWSDGETRDVHTDMLRVALDIAGRTLFGADVTTDAREIAGALDTILAAFDKQFDSKLPLPDTVPTPRNLRLRRTVKGLDTVVYRLIAERRATNEDRRDLLSLLLHAQDEDGSRMTDAQLRDEVMTILLASHETAAIALTWLWYLLGRHEQVEARLVEELERVLGGRAPTLADVPELRYTDMVVREVLRVYPPAWFFPRMARREVELAGYRVRRGESVILSPWVVHRDARWFENPEHFEPERWADGLADSLPKYAYFPFGGGPRLCIGAPFAMLELVLTTAVLAQRFRFSRTTDQVVEPRATFTLRQASDVPMTLYRR
jgi:cytochrome P450